MISKYLLLRFALLHAGCPHFSVGMLYDAIMNEESMVLENIKKLYNLFITIKLNGVLTDCVNRSKCKMKDQDICEK